MQVYSARNPNKGGRETGERVRLMQLVWAVGLAVCLLLGRQFCPEHLMRAGERVLAVVSSSTELDTALSRVGEHLAVSGEAATGLREFCVSVFGPMKGEHGEAEEVFAPQTPEIRAGVLSTQVRPQTMLTKLCGQTREDDTAPVGAVLVAAPKPEQMLPEGHTLDKLSLGDLETASPVLGALNSGFGYREHPVNGKHRFHSGVDINADFGDAIGAFADGVVEYLGEDDSYGLYLQLDHGNGIKSFYAHCQKLCVETGQQVAAGETIALVGATGTATGPHLHLELKCGGVRIDPAWYVELPEG